jgi:hypothetical protein
VLAVHNPSRLGDSTVDAPAVCDYCLGPDPDPATGHCATCQATLDGAA